MRGTSVIALAIPIVSFSIVVALIWILPAFGQECFGSRGSSETSEYYCAGPLGSTQGWVNDHAWPLTTTLTVSAYLVAGGMRALVRWRRS